MSGVTAKVAKVAIEGDSTTAPEGGRSDRTFVKDKSAKLEAKLERENQKKQVIYIYNTMWQIKLFIFIFF